MATRSRLGRDPLREVAQPDANKNTKAAAKPKSGAKTPAKRQPAKKPPVAADPKAPLEAATSPASQEPAVDVMPTSLPDAVVPTPETVLEQSAAASVTEQAIPDVPAPSAPETVTAATPEVASQSLSGAAPSLCEPETAGPVGLATPQADPTATEDAVPQPEAAEAPFAVDMHPVAVFLRGVLDGLNPEGSIRLCVSVATSAYALPVEKLFYFSHAIQLIVSPLEWPGNVWKRPSAVKEPFPALTAILEAYGNGKHVLRLYDNGLFFRSYYPQMRLDMEALRPLVLFVTQRGGSLCIKQGQSVEFEIIG